MKFVTRVTEEAKLLEEHAVVILKTAIKLPGIGLAAGVHHLEAGFQAFLRKSVHVRALAGAEVHLVVGDTEAAVKAIVTKLEGEIEALKSAEASVRAEWVAAEEDVEALAAKLKAATEAGVKATEYRAMQEVAHVLDGLTRDLDTAKLVASKLSDKAAAAVEALGAAHARLEGVKGVEGVPEALDSANIAAAKAAAEAKVAADAAAAKAAAEAVKLKADLEAAAAALKATTDAKTAAEFKPATDVVVTGVDEDPMQAEHA